MKFPKKFLAFSFLPALLLSSCGKAETPLSAYLSELPFQENFSLLQLSDLHWSITTDFAKQKAYLDAVYSAAKAASGNQRVSLLVLTGDLFLLATKATAKTLLDEIASWGVPFTFCWGNHDRQNDFSPSWLETLLSSYPLSLYRALDDTLSGLGNGVINLNENGKTLWQIYTLDSHGNEQSSVPLKYSYGHIDSAQVEWFKKEADLAHNVPSLAYCHVPLAEFKAFVEARDYTTLEGEKNIGIYSSEKDADFFTNAKAHNVKGIFFGHDHGNDLTMLHDGVKIGYGLKTGRELSYASSASRTYALAGTGVSHPLDLTGGSLSILHGDGSYSLKHVYVMDETNYPSVVEEF